MANRSIFFSCILWLIFKGAYAYFSGLTSFFSLFLGSFGCYIGMATLISQAKNTVSKIKRENESLEEQTSVYRRVSDITSGQSKKRGKKQERNFLQFEEERELKKPEDSLFSFLYFPAPFREENDEDRQEVDESDSMFFLDKSGSGAWSIGEERVELAGGSPNVIHACSNEKKHTLHDR